MTLLGYLPVTNNADETYNITILNTTYILRQLYNTIGFWTISIADNNNNSIVDGVKVCTGVNMLEQYPQLLFDLYIIDNIIPTRDNFKDLFIGVYEK